MDLEERISYNALNIALNSNYELLKKTFSSAGSWRKAWQKRENNKLPLANSRINDPEKEWLGLEKEGIRLVMDCDPEFPPQLQEIPWPPFGLYIKGTPLSPGETMIAIVGTRKATGSGMDSARVFARDLAGQGITIVSGLALGLDAAAHEGALQAGGRTIAVLANGLEKIYPRQNAGLADRILKNGGAIIGEYPIGSPSLKNRFIERNRIVSGLSKGVLVIEAPEKSGALATARFALDQNREVFVVPGQIKHPNYSGSHALIKAGASLVTETADILQGLNMETRALSVNAGGSRAILGKLGEEEKTVFTALEAAGRSMRADEIAHLVNLETKKINQSLSFLVIKGIIKEQNGKYLI